MNMRYASYLAIAGGMVGVDPVVQPHQARATFVGTTPCGDTVRAFVGIPAGAKCPAIKWQLMLGTPDDANRWRLTAGYAPPLAANGGPTQTHALLPGSPAIDAGGTSANGCPATDQRGFPRPQGGACDIGAFEFLAPPPPAARPSGAQPPPSPPDPAPQPRGGIGGAGNAPGPTPNPLPPSR